MEKSLKMCMPCSWLHIGCLLGAKVFGYTLNFFNLIRERRKAINKRAIKPVLVFALLIAFASVAIAQMTWKGWEKTVTLPSGEVILDMSGEWDSHGEFYGPWSWMQPVSGILIITQEGTAFICVKQIASQWVPEGAQTIKGELDKDGFKAVYVYMGAHPRDGTFGWKPCKWEIRENGNKIVVDEGDVVRATLTR